MTSAATYQCPDCQRAELFEPTTSADDLEWACTVCGAALIIDPVLADSSKVLRAA